MQLKKSGSEMCHQPVNVEKNDLVEERLDLFQYICKRRRRVIPPPLSETHPP